MSRTYVGLLFGLAAAARVTYLPLALIFLVLNPTPGKRTSDQNLGGVVVLLAVTTLTYVPAAI